jgi:hypothetical protein
MLRRFESELQKELRESGGIINPILRRDRLPRRLRTRNRSQFSRRLPRRRVIHRDSDCSLGTPPVVRDHHRRVPEETENNRQKRSDYQFH